MICPYCTKYFPTYNHSDSWEDTNCPKCHRKINVSKGCNIYIISFFITAILVYKFLIDPIKDIIPPPFDSGIFIRVVTLLLFLITYIALYETLTMFITAKKKGGDKVTEIGSKNLSKKNNIGLTNRENEPSSIKNDPKKWQKLAAEVKRRIDGQFEYSEEEYLRYEQNVSISVRYISKRTKRICISARAYE